jgi:ATP-dependent DNA helicase RecG
VGEPAQGHSAGPVEPDSPVQYFKGVGPVRAKLLERLGIRTARDLLHHYPVDYRTPAVERAIAEVRPGERVIVRGRVLDVQKRKGRRGRGFLVAVMGEGNARLVLTWFNAPWMSDRLRVGRELIASGEVTEFRGRLQIVNPQIETQDETRDSAVEGGSSGPVPRYPLTAGLKQLAMRQLVARAIDALIVHEPEPLDEELRERFGLQERPAALRALHHPESIEEVAEARRRLAFDEALALQLAVGIRRSRLLRREARVRLTEHTGLSSEYVARLGFTLTGAQRKVLSAIAKDLRAEYAMHRLVQGDVGSGKTVVGVIAMLFAVEAKGQAAFMAPTEVLARQHAKRQIPLLDALGVRGELLTGSTPSSERKRVLTGVRDGSVDILFGTHALIQDGVEFRELGLAIVDEQHRFGVMQRAALGSGGAHLLVMSATPIPRSLALTVYGDLDLSIIDEIPPGRKPVVTDVIAIDRVERVWPEIIERAGRGEQSFLVYPLVEESEALELESAEDAFERLGKGPLAGIRVGLLHGRMKADEKEEVAARFGRGEIDALVATTVIEVGIDIPDASLMIIHHAERFGLGQLHQLRGRVGRGAVSSHCVLATSEGVSPPALRRLRELAATTDGFRVAELDLRERGMGDLHGVRQHGELPFRLLNPLEDALLVEQARELARELLDADPHLDDPVHAPVADWLEQMGRRSPVWSAAG